MNEPSARRKLLLIGTVWPETTSSAAGVRTFGMLRALRSRGWDVHFWTPAQEKREWIEALLGIGVPSRCIAVNDSAFDAALLELSPDFVVFDRFLTEEQFGWRVRRACPAAVRVLDTVDLHFLRRARALSLADRDLGLESEDALREVSSILRSDLTLLISGFEEELLRSHFQIPSEALALYRFAYPRAERAQGAPSPAVDERQGYVMIGNFRHPPNADATRWLKSELWPAIRKLDPGARVDVYGAYPSREITSLTDASQGFHVLGPASRLFETLARYRVNLAPLRFGAGLKGKIADGWFAGLPVVTTPVGAEGMRLPNGEFGGIVAERADEFAAAAVRLHRDSELRARLAETGARALQELFDETRENGRLFASLDAAERELERRRQTNWTGRMLWHHTLRSTEYFSRWIELKEKHRTAAGNFNSIGLVPTSISIEGETRPRPPT